MTSFDTVNKREQLRVISKQFEELVFALSVGKQRYRTHSYVRFEGFTAVTMKNGVFWDVTPCGSCKNQRFGGTYRLHHQGDKNR
jgi:hypothetical protein